MCHSIAAEASEEAKQALEQFKTNMNVRLSEPAQNQYHNFGLTLDLFFQPPDRNFFNEPEDQHPNFHERAEAASEKGKGAWTFHKRAFGRGLH